MKCWIFLGHNTSKNGCTLLAPSSVKDEYTCSANSMKSYEELSTFFDSLGIIPIEKIDGELSASEGVKFNIALRRSKVRDPSYVDRSLLFIPCIYKDSSEKIFVMTSNYKDVPREFYDLVGFISYDQEGFHNIGFYQFNYDNYQKIIERV